MLNGIVVLSRAGFSSGRDGKEKSGAVWDLFLLVAGPRNACVAAEDVSKAREDEDEGASLIVTFFVECIGVC